MSEETIPSIIPYDEWTALQSFYISSNGVYWIYKNNNNNNIAHWNFTHYPTNNPCYDQCYYYTNSLSTQCNVQKLVLVQYNLTGTISSAIGSLQNITILNINRNNLYGSIPREIGQLRKLQKIEISSNKLKGIIPSSLGNLVKLQYIGLHFNSLTGTIPSSLGKLSELKILYLNSNLLKGIIPSSFGNLYRLQSLYLYANMLTNTIPSSLFIRLKQLQSLQLSVNMLEGNFPTSIENCLKLEEISLNSNLLTGSIPSSISNLKFLTSLDFGSNMLTGTIPSFLGSLIKLKNIVLSYNSLTGTLPFLFGHNLQALELNSNKLTGTIPNSFGNLNNLSQLYLYSNYLSGIIPSSIGGLTQLEFLNLTTNYLTGSIPASLGDLHQRLKYLSLFGNSLEGTIPSSLGRLDQLLGLDLHFNSLTGTIPSTLRTLKSLLVLFLYSNILTGSLDNVFNSTLQINLQTIQINNNQLSGRLPEEMFKLQKLMTFNAVSNCFSVEIPYLVICKSLTLTHLILDGLHTASSCRQSIFFSSSYTLKINVNNNNQFHPCLFEMVSLSTLHLSGNAITGNIPDCSNNISQRLTNLSLSHNLITGTLPSCITSKKWNYVDLSFNRIDGVLSSGFAYQNISSTLIFQQNRLSGIVPSSMLDINNINILNGNIFSCNLAKSDIPRYDSDISNYNCGSNSFDIPYYFWLGILFGLIISFLYLRFIYEKKVNSNNKYLFWNIIYNPKTIYGKDEQIVIDEVGSNITKIKEKQNDIIIVLFYLTIYIITILLIIYSLDSYFYGIYTYQYGWTVSLAFQSGSIAFALTCVCLCLLIWFLLFLIITTTSKHKQSKDEVNEININETDIEKANNDPYLSFSLSWTVTPLINVIVVGGVNVLYVFLFLNISSDAMVVVQIFLAMFKSFWNAFGYKHLSRIINNRLNVDNMSLKHSSLQLFIRLLNNIIIPCVVVAIINKDCFYNLFIPAPAVTAVFTYDLCVKVNPKTRLCDSYAIQTENTTFDPPFVYSFQCNSRFITYYAPAFVFLCIIDGFVVPISQLVGVQIYKYGLKNKIRYVTYFGKLIPKLLRIYEVVDNNKNNNIHKIERINKYHPYFDSLELFLNDFTYLGLIMTFGAVFPPLAASFFVTIYLMNLSLWFQVNNFINFAKENNRIYLVEIIDIECKGCLDSKIVIRSMWIIIILSCLFYSLFLFDTLGESVGASSAFWSLIFVPIFPLLTYLLYKSRFMMRFFSSKEKTKENNNADTLNNSRDSAMEIIIVGNPIIPADIPILDE